MSQPPFGFAGGTGGADEGGSGSGGSGGGNPFGNLFGGMFGPGGGGPADLGAALHQLADLLSWTGGPVNWKLASQVAGQAAGSDDPNVTDADHKAVAEAMRLADLWLDAVTSLPSGVAGAEAWTRTRWVAETQQAWAALCDPVAGRVVDAMQGLLGQAGAQGALPPELAAITSGFGAAGGGSPLAGLEGILRQLGGAMFGSQVGSALGTLAGEVVGATDIGLPLGPAGRAALIPRNVAEFGEGLGVPLDEVRLYLALREAAHHRLFGHVPWLRGHLLDAIDAYGRGFHVDLAGLQEKVQGLDPSNMNAVQEAITGGLLVPEETPAQQAALRRLETLLALIEGWVDHVVDSAAAAHLPSSAALREAVRRRRATGGPAEQTFATLVGLELRPRRLREASALWSALADARGPEARDGLWGHPDLLPGSEDLDDPGGFARRRDDDIDLAALAEDAHQSDSGQSSSEPSESSKDDPQDPESPAG